MTKLATLEFDRNRKSMSVIVGRGAESSRPAATTRRSSKDQGNVLMVKGAAECVLARCNKVRAVPTTQVLCLQMSDLL